MTISVALSLGMSLLFALLAVPLIRRRVPPNGYYGLRVPATFADESVWYEANARAGVELLVLGLFLLTLSLALPPFGVSNRVFGLVWSVAAVCGTLVIAIAGWRRANCLLAERQRDPKQRA